jgi:AAA domain-containing protein
MATPVPRPVGSPPTPTPNPARPAAPVPRPAVSPPQRAAPAQPTKQSRLGLSKRERLSAPLFYLWYGVEGVGKTSLLADMPNPLLNDIEGRSTKIEVARYVYRDEPGGHVPRTYEEFLSGIDDLIANPGHGYRTLGIDTADALEALIHAHICKRDGEENVEGYGYGKGYKVAVAELRVLISRLNVLRYRDNMNIAIAAHAKAKTFKNPEGPDFDRWQIVGDDLFTAELRARCDVVGFIHFEGGGSKMADEAKSKSARARGWDTGRRLIELVRTAAWDAKSCLSVPVQIELALEHPFQPFSDAKVVAEVATTDTLAADILAEVDRITGGNRYLEFTTDAGTKTSFAAIQDITTKSDASVLARVLAGLKATSSTVATQETTP